MTEPDPRDYPWPEPGVTGVLGPDGITDGLPRRLGSDLTPVLAVGSNAAPGVLRRKLGDHLAAGMPVTTARVGGLAIGHSAHVSLRGYVPAAPYLQPSAECLVGVAWLSAAQLEALDATEPNYERVGVGLTCRTAAGVTLEDPQLYDSRHGVLAHSGTVLPLSSQGEVVAWLARRLPGAGRLGLLNDSPYDALARPDLRQRVREAIIEAGLATASGLRLTQPPEGR